MIQVLMYVWAATKMWTMQKWVKTKYDMGVSSWLGLYVFNVGIPQLTFNSVVMCDEIE
jgi:hypothetical protein